MIEGSWALGDVSHEGTTTVVDGARGIASHASFLDTPAGRLFSCYHGPTRAVADMGVVVCPPVLAEAPRNYRREVLLAQRLAAAGWAVLRFHHRGAGHSDDGGPTGLDELVEDALEAAAHLAGRTSTGRVAFVGTRLGALVAARAHREHRGSPLVLWEPVVDPAGYFRELIRARLTTDIKRGASAGAAALRNDLEAGRPMEISGYVLAPELYASTICWSLPDALGEPDGPLLVVELDGRGRGRPEVRALVERWRASGHLAEADVVELDEPWWFGASSRSDTYDAHTTGLRVVTATVDFLSRVVEP